MKTISINLSKLLVSSLVLALISACSVRVDIEDLNHWMPEKTTLVSSAEVLANGQERALVKLILFGVNSKPITGIQLTASSLHSGMSLVSCSVSDGTGLVDCFFTSITPGINTAVLTDGTLTWSVDINFLVSPYRSSITSIGSTPKFKTVESGYTIISGVNKTTGSLQTESGYKIRTEARPYQFDFSSP